LKRATSVAAAQSSNTGGLPQALRPPHSPGIHPALTIRRGFHVLLQFDRSLQGSIKVDGTFA
jgi:hypothetical protein